MGRPRKYANKKLKSITIPADLAALVKNIAQGEQKWHSYLVEFKKNGKIEKGGLYGDPTEAVKNGFRYRDFPEFDKCPVNITEFSNHNVTAEIQCWFEDNQIHYSSSGNPSEAFMNAFEDMYKEL